MSPYIVHLPAYTLVQHQVKRRAMVPHMQPIPDILAVPVYGYLLVIDDPGDG
ncbi:hypothetical protein D3C75_1219360 [compost metagenome]